ncbi:MAG: ABC transporter ATP-binding protein [Desulfomonile tiedjei]|uniref:ABC transporter ATP-binding protein n=1 Tax=Desulfomonile tiedjei TaxID=2358 RepID=A0A9D6Z5F0_9BACT|nr:ABC transporter ATP-binding protein [Desulfomonile tiedjei]
MAVSGVNLVVNRGDIHAVIGPNGAGKSTLFNLITNYFEPSAGRVLFKGQDITGRPAHAICRMGLARSFQLTNIYPKLTVFESVQMSLLSIEGLAGSLFGSTGKLLQEDTENVLEMVGLIEQRDLIGNLLSHGDKKRLELAITLGNRPEMLLMDEPTAGMAPDETWEIVDLVNKLRLEENLTILFTEHDMDVVFEMADRVSVLHQGLVICDAVPEEVQKDEMVRECYLGSAWPVTS